jgi:hypothetical protein
MDNIYVPNLEISYIYDMFIVWNSFIINDSNVFTSLFHGFIRVLLSETPNRDYKNMYADYIGSTIKSERGFIIYSKG